MYGDECRSDGCLFRHPWDESDVEVSDEIKKLATELEAQSLASSPAPPPPVSSGIASNFGKFASCTFEEWVAGGCLTPDPSVWFVEEEHVNEFTMQVETRMGQRSPEKVFVDLVAARFPGVAKKKAEPSGWAAVAAKIPPPPPASSAAAEGEGQGGRGEVRVVEAPPQLWSSIPDPQCYHIRDAMDRYAAVNAMEGSAEHVKLPPTMGRIGPVGKVDFHYQSLATLSRIIKPVVSEAMKANKEVWIITGKGNHVDKDSFQKQGGVLQTEVERWLMDNEIRYAKGKVAGAILIY